MSIIAYKFQSPDGSYWYIKADDQRTIEYWRERRRLIPLDDTSARITADGAVVESADGIWAPLDGPPATPAREVGAEWRPKVLSGPRTHVCWTPDYTPKDQRINVVLISEADYNRCCDLLSAPPSPPVGRQEAIPEGEPVAYLWRHIRNSDGEETNRGLSFSKVEPTNNAFWDGKTSTDVTPLWPRAVAPTPPESAPDPARAALAELVTALDEEVANGYDPSVRLGSAADRGREVLKEQGNE